MCWFVSLFVLKELAPAKQLTRSQLCCQHRFLEQKRRPKKQSIPLLRMRESLLSYSVTLGKKFALIVRVLFLVALVENPPMFPLNSKKLKTKKGTGTATILTITEMLQQYKNSGAVARLTALTLTFTERNT